MRRAKSHPTWVRGLKHRLRAIRHAFEASHPTWVRGLKLLVLHIERSPFYVAPYVGAWIET